MTENSARRASAKIIPFPHSAAADENAHLASALAALEDALAEQHRAILAWQAQLGALREAVGGLAGAMTGFRGRLDRLDTQVRGIGAEARRLESWADAAISQVI